MRIISAALLLTIATPAIAADDPPHAINETDKAALQEAIKYRLTDPDSAKFKWLPATGTGHIYCGFVNSKNRFGGYVGFVPFAAMIFEHQDGKPWAGPLGVGSAIPDAPDTLAIVQMCAKAGIDMSGPTSQ